MHPDRLRISLKYSWIGYALGLAAMAGLLIFGVVTARAGVTVIASTTAAVLGAMWATTHASLKRQLERSVRS